MILAFEAGAISATVLVGAFLSSCEVINRAFACLCLVKCSKAFFAALPHKVST